jgi:hypothetical protein
MDNDIVPTFALAGGAGTNGKTVAAKERAKNHFANYLTIKRIIENPQVDWLNTVDEQRLCSVPLFQEFGGYLVQLKQRDDVTFY